MYHQFLKCFPKEDYLIDIFEYIRMSTDDILMLNKEEPKDDEEAEEEKTDCDEDKDED